MIVLKTIYGFEISYAQALIKSGLEKLSDRAKKLSTEFAIKTSNNPKYSSWFPKKADRGYPLRRPLIYEEELAAESRLFNSPLFNMRRILNN